MTTPSPPAPSAVEAKCIAVSGRRGLQYPGEAGKVLEVATFPRLGLVAAARFLEWVQDNPGGVISLPTGRTPEHFIGHVARLLAGWEEREVQAELEELGVNVARGKPDMHSLTFVQMDEFYPIDPEQANSFHSYIEKYYIQNFGLDPAKAMLMNLWTVGCPEGRNAGEIFDTGIDLSLRLREATSKEEQVQQAVLRAVDNWCANYERKIRKLGGLGLWLGGIGPDGHVAFNCAGGDLYSTTRLCGTNYPTQAAAAGDLGGIETARNRLVVTIGLGTITAKKDAVAIVFAAGDAKARVVKRAVTSEWDVDVPASALHLMDGARFLLTKSAASLLPRRRVEDLAAAIEKKKGDGSLEENMIQAEEEALIDLALALHIRLVDITLEDAQRDLAVSQLLMGHENPEEVLRRMCLNVSKNLEKKLDAGLQQREDVSIIHTAPHHDDIMLGYLPFAASLLESDKNKHKFSYGTSGFNAVTNSYTSSRLEQTFEYLQTNECKTLVDSGYFAPSNKAAYDEDATMYLDGHAARSVDMKEEAVCRRLIRILIATFAGGEEEEEEWDTAAAAAATAAAAAERDHSWICRHCGNAISYLASRYMGQKDIPKYQKFKGMIREFEADLLWGYHGFLPSQVVTHWRLGFYKGDLFTEQPEVTRDVLPVLDQMRDMEPDFISVALDPEGSGPDTHYKVLQVVSQAVRLYKREKPDSSIRVWGYRNVWFRFHPAEANIFVPVSLGELSSMNDAFDTCFLTQREASFPAPEYNGPFSHWAQQIQASQYRNLRTLLGADYFQEHADPRVRRARGFVFIHELTSEEFALRARELHDTAET